MPYNCRRHKLLQRDQGNSGQQFLVEGIVKDMKTTDGARISSKDEKEEIEDIIAKIVKEFQKSLHKYPNPKKYADKVLKQLKSRVTRAAIFLMLTTMSLKPEEIYSPKELAKRLPKEMRLTPVQLNGVLTKLMKEGFFVKEKKDRGKKHPGRHKSGENILYKRGGGRPSYYVVTEGHDKLRNFMSDSEASQIVHDCLKKNGIIQEYYKYVILAIFYAMRKEGNSKGLLFEQIKSSSPYAISGITESDFSSWDSYSKLILSLDETQLDALAERAAILITENNPFDYFIYLLMILPKP
jgi:hypothetical protein